VGDRGSLSVSWEPEMLEQFKSVPTSGKLFLTTIFRNKDLGKGSQLAGTCTISDRLCATYHSKSVVANRSPTSDTVMRGCSVRMWAAVTWW
jgi:hypothetical protein